MEIVLLAAVLMVVGMIGTVVPGIPGLGLVWAGALVYGIFEGFGPFGTAAFVVISVIAVLGSIATYVLPAKRAGDAGAHRNSIVLGVVLAVVGAFVIPVIGLFVGGVGGIYLGERSRQASHEVAWRSTMATLIGFGIGALVEILSAAVCIAIWIAWVIAN